MRRRSLVAGLFLAFVATACGSSSPPTGPTPIVTPPADSGAPTPAQPAPVPPGLRISRILSFGDSMTEGTTSPVFTGFGLTPGLPQSYPFKLQSLLNARYGVQVATVANSGIAGRLATADRDRLTGALSEAKPELLILIEGANDLNAMSDAGLGDVSPVVAALEDMVRDAQGRGAKVIVGTLPPQRTSATSKGKAGALLAKYNRDLKTMAAKKGATLVDLNALVPLSMIGQDGLHPTEAAYQLFAEIFLDAIKSAYEVTPTAVRP